MKNYRDMFFSTIYNATIQEMQYPDNVKISKHWNKGFNKKRSGVYMTNHRKDAHVW